MPLRGIKAPTVAKDIMVCEWHRLPGNAGSGLIGLMILLT
jgi:hypothetical protein